MSKLYKYTIYGQDGSIQQLEPCTKKSFGGQGGLYELLKCSTIEIIPRDYYDDRGWGRCTVYGDEEGRFNSENKTNPHFKTLAPGWDVVGDIIKEEVFKNVE